MNHNVQPRDTDEDDYDVPTMDARIIFAIEVFVIYCLVCFYQLFPPDLGPLVTAFFLTLTIAFISLISRHYSRTSPLEPRYASSDESDETERPAGFTILRLSYTKPDSPLWKEWRARGPAFHKLLHLLRISERILPLLSLWELDYLRAVREGAHATAFAFNRMITTNSMGLLQEVEEEWANWPEGEDQQFGDDIV